MEEFKMKKRFLAGVLAGVLAVGALTACGSSNTQSSKATQMQISADDLTPEKMQAYQKAQGEVGSALSRLLAITEAYPDLKANENFKELQAQLEGTENRISVERKRFNDTARAYNTAIRTFPRNLLAGMFGFDKRPYFESEEGADKAPKVEF